MKENNAFEDQNLLNYKLSSMAVGNEKKSLELPQGKCENDSIRSSLSKFYVSKFKRCII